MTKLTDEAELEIKCLLSGKNVTCPYRRALIDHFGYTDLSPSCAYRKILKLKLEEHEKDVAYEDFMSNYGPDPN